MAFRMEINSENIKIACVGWLRFRKRLQLIATECGRWSSDVLACDDKDSVEIEVKVDKYDLRRDFDKRKHKAYEDGTARGWTPKYFYFAVPYDLMDEALLIIKNKGPKYGLMVFEPREVYQIFECLRVVKRPTKLHDGAIAKRMQRDVAYRMGSELFNLYAHKEYFFKEIRSIYNHASKKIVNDLAKARTDLEMDDGGFCEEEHACRAVQN